MFEKVTNNCNYDDLVKFNNNSLNFVTKSKDILTCKNVWESYNSQIIEVTVNDKVKEELFVKHFTILMQNCVSMVLQEMCDKINTREKVDLITRYIKYCNLKEENGDGYECIINRLKTIFFFFCQEYVDRFMVVNDKDKANLKEHLKFCFSYYEKFLRKKSSLFEIMIYKTANEAFFNKLLTSSEWLLIYYYPKGLTATINFNILSSQKKDFTITVSDIEDIKFYSPVLFFEYAKNKSEHSILVKKILSAYSKKKKIKNNSDNNYIEDNNLEENNVNHFNLDEGLDGNIIINSEGLSEKDKNMIFKQLQNIGKNRSSFKILLKKTENSTIFPYGMEVICKHDSGLQNLSKGNVVYLSAKYSDYNLLTHKSHNNMYSNYLKTNHIIQEKHFCNQNQRKINYLFIIQSEYSLFKQTIWKEFYQTFWNNFLYRFYVLFSKKKKKNIQRTGIIALPSQK